MVHDSVQVHGFNVSYEKSKMIFASVGQTQKEMSHPYLFHIGFLRYIVISIAGHPPGG